MYKLISQSFAAKLLAVIMVVGGVKLVITGQAGQRADFAFGDHVRIAGAVCFIIGIVLGYNLLRKKQ